MKRFENILFVPLARRNNPAAVRRIADLADRNGAELTVLGVVATPSRWRRLLDRPVLDAAIGEAEQHALVERLQTCCHQVGHDRARPLVARGDPALTIIRTVLGANHDLVVVTSDEDREDHSTVKRLLRECPCPVWVIRQTRARTQRVLAAVNPDPDEAELNAEILGFAASLTALFGGELHVVHAWEPEGESTLRSSAFIRLSREEVDTYVAEVEATHRTALDRLLVATDDDETDRIVHFVKGRPEDVVPQLIARRRLNVLVLGTVARTGLAGIIIGNTAESIVDEVRCSVVAIKPPGFVSSVAP